MSRMERLVVCSSPNGRGISKYAAYLSELIEGTLITCGRRTRSFVMWESFGILRYAREIVRAKEVVFVNSRVSPLLWMILDWRKVVIVVHDVMDTDGERMYDSAYLGTKMKIRRAANSWIMKKSIEKAGKIIFNSNYTESEVIRWVGEVHGRTCVIYPPPSFERMITEEKVRSGRFEAGRKTLKLLAVTGTTKNKAYEAYKEFHERLEERLGMPVVFVIYGIELREATADFRRWATRMSDRIMIRFRRKEEELLEDYLDCDIVVSLSTEEGYGMPVADALGFGVPVVARSIGSYREIKVNLDDCDMVHLAVDIDSCVEMAATLISRSDVEVERDRKYDRYKSFCIRSRNRAIALLEGLNRRG